MTFTRSTKNRNVYRVHNGSFYLGTVTRKEFWTVRGTRVAWVAQAAGLYASESTRKAAAEALLRHETMEPA